MTKTFLLGVGAQKAGTTWLYQYLANHPECNMGTIKEYAVFNTYFRPDLFSKRPINRLRNLERLAGRYVEEVERKKTVENPEKLLNAMDALSLSLDPDRYVPHFDRLFAARPEVRLVGDMTPEYSALDAEHFGRIRTMLEAGGYRLKVVFLMRDPVERCFSAIRMSERDRRREMGSAPEKPAHERFAVEASSHWCDIRTRYEKTISALEAVFDPRDIFYGIYETFFTPAKVRELTDFLGIAPRAPNLEKRANRSPRTDEPDQLARAHVRAHYADTYDFCAQKFGKALIDSIWTSGEGARPVTSTSATENAQ